MHTKIVRPALLAIVIAMVLVAGCVPAPLPTPAPGMPAPVLEPTAAIPAGEATAEPSDTGASASGITGHWEGRIVVQGQALATRLDVATENGALTGTIDFPEQSLNSLPLNTISFEDGRVYFDVLPAPNTATFDGELGDNGRITGMFEQAGFTGEFALSRVDAAQAEPLPYVEEEITFQNGDVTLAGTLTLPENPGPHPAVVLISGSGAQNRDEEVFGFRIFREIADRLTREGIAVLRYDDRGIGGSSGGTAEDTSETFAGDAGAAVEFLLSRPDINPAQIGLIGHSEGGMIAPMVAVESDDVAFVILMSGTGTPGRQVLEEQGRLINEASGRSEEEVEQTAEVQRRLFDAAVSGEGLDEVRAILVEEFRRIAADLPEDQRQLLGDIDEWAAQAAESQIDAVQSPWMLFFLAHDPAPVLEQLDVPVLALFGGLDLQVPEETNRPAMEAALERGGNPDVTVEVFPDANHLYQRAQTGSPDEYAILPPEFTPGFLDTISEWILERVDVPGQ